MRTGGPSIWKPPSTRNRRGARNLSLRGSGNFWDDFYRLSPSQKEAARNAWQIFKLDPFDPRLRSHKIHRLSAVFGKTIYAVDIEGDLRSLFYIEGGTVWSVRIGTHALYNP